MAWGGPKGQLLRIDRHLAGIVADDELFQSEQMDRALDHRGESMLVQGLMDLDTCFARGPSECWVQDGRHPLCALAERIHGQLVGNVSGRIVLPQIATLGIEYGC